MIDVDDTTYLLMHGEMDSTDDIMEAVEQEQEHRFHNYRVLIHEIESLRAEVKRLREGLIAIQRSLIWDGEDRAMDGESITLEALVAQVEQVRSDITEMIE